MSTNWTDEQKQAIYTRDCNLLVAAGAGAGKTAVLVKRIIEKITDDKCGVDIDKLLVVTFTNAAASEMKERVGEAISSELEKNPESKKFQRQLVLLGKSNIMTIHSFCLKVIKDNFHIVDLDPNFRVCDDTEAVLLKQEAVDELIEEKYEEDDREFLNLLECYGKRNDSKIENLILDLHKFSMSNPYPQKWLTNMVEKFNIDDHFDFEKSKWAQTVVKYIKFEASECKNKLQVAIDIVRNAEGIDYYIEPLQNDLCIMEDILDCNDWKSMDNLFTQLTFKKLPIKRNKDADKEARERAKKIRDDVKKKILQIKEDIFSESLNMTRDIKQVYGLLKCLVNLVISFDDKYSMKKKERGVIDFNDIEHFCLSILTEVKENNKIIPSKIALEYRNDFEEILIDEYQDSNEVQEVIMNAVAKKMPFPNMFMVGDVKQSIYRFRKAKPELFLEKYNTYSEQDGSKERKIKLFKNFRSRPEIIDGVNYIFAQIMSKKVGEIDYDESEFLKCGMEFPKNECDMSIELNLIDKKESNHNGIISDKEDEESLDNIQAEARFTARRINELVNKNENFMIYDKNINDYRHVEYKDIVILLRATSNWAPIYVEELMNEGIPVFADTAVGYFDTPEIKTIMCLLQIIDNPMQDIPLLAVLRSPIESFEPEELIDIRMVNREVSFYSAMKIIDKYFDGRSEESSDLKNLRYQLDNISNELKNKVSTFLKRLDGWRNKSLCMDLDRFIWYLYTDTGYYGFVGAMPGGKQRQANLRMLFNKAIEYEGTSYKGLFNFINFINKIKYSSGDMGSAKILGENENVIRIMSIHKSKGLEFPVVILSGMGKNFNFMDMNRNVLFHSDLGFGADYVDPDKRISYPTLPKQIIKKKIKIETLSEEMRILYVAFTRAKEKLIMTGMVNDIDKTCKKWCENSRYNSRKMPESYTAAARSYLDWIGAALTKHRDGNIIREVGNCENFNYIVEDNSKWKINLYNKGEFKKNLNGHNNEKNIMQYIENIDLNLDISRCSKEIYRRLDWKYKYGRAQNINSKMSVSEIKRKFLLNEDEDSKLLFDNLSLNTPRFLQKTKSISAAEKGTLMHLVMQKLNLQEVFSYDAVKNQIENLIAKGFITRDESKYININKILNFFDSKLGRRMLNSKNIYRERPFIVNLSSTEIYKDLPKDIYENEKILVQGVIDCYFEEGDGLILVDYKTDYIENIQEVEQKYKFQIEYYSKALEMITEKKVKDKYLYLFSNNKFIKI